MKFRKEYISQDVAGSKLLVSLDTELVDFNKMLTLNETGAFLWECLQNGASEEELLGKMTDEYDIDSETAKRDIEKFIADLRTHEIIY